MNIDLGDAQLEINLRIPGLTRHRFVLHVGAPRDTSPADRVIKGPPYGPSSREAGVRMDLQADKAVDLSGEWTDEVGNPVEMPADAAVTYAVDDPTIINLTDHGDGTAEAAAVGTPGTANVHAEATSAGRTVTADLQIVVVAGLAERFNIVAGEPREVTPDV